MPQHEYNDPAIAAALAAAAAYAGAPAPAGTVYQPNQQQQQQQQPAYHQTYQPQQQQQHSAAPHQQQQQVGMMIAPPHQSVGQPRSIHRGVRSSDVDRLVEEVFTDNSMKNISFLPAPVSRSFYTSAIKLTLNLFYKTMGKFDGLVMTGGNRLKLNRVTYNDTANKNARSAGQTGQMWQAFQSQINMQPIQQLVDRLLANPAVNQKMIPDHVERDIYTNCMKIVFWVLHLLSNQFGITLCGHLLKLDMKPTTAQQQSTTGRGYGNRGGAGGTSRDNASVDMMSSQALAEFSQQADYLLDLSGDDDDDDANFGTRGSSNNRHSTKNRMSFNFMRQSMDRAQQNMLKSLNGSLYSLLLGIMGDMLQSTSVRLLSDELSFQVVQPQQYQQQAAGRGHGDRGGMSPQFAVQREEWNRQFRQLSIHERMMLLQDLQSMI